MNLSQEERAEKTAKQILTDLECDHDGQVWKMRDHWLEIEAKVNEFFYRHASR